MASVGGLRDGLLATYDAFEELADTLAPAEWDLPTGCPGWTVKDQFSHVVGLEGWMAGDAQPEHQLPSELPHVRSDVGRYMEVHVDVRRPVPVEDLRRELHDVLSRRRAWLATLTEHDDQLPIRGPMGEAPLRSVLGIRVFDLFAHEQDIRRATDHRGNLDGPAAVLVRGRIIKGLARALPEALGHPAATLTIDVTTPSPTATTIDLADGTVLDEPVSDPTVALRVTFEDLIALATGRSDAPEEVDAAGDAHLIERIVAALTLTP